MNNVIQNCLIILNYNDAKSCINLINEVESYNNIEKIILVDNCSTDDSFDILSLHYLQNEKVDVLQAPNNGGYASGNNYGAFYAIHNYNPYIITIANPDVSFEENTLNKILNVYKEKSDAAIVTCKMICPLQKLPVAWKLPNYWDCILENFIILTKIIGNRCIYSENELLEPIVNVDVLPGSFLSIRTECFKKVEGFDDKTFLYYEENIIAKRMKENGFSNYLVTTENYLHNHSVSIDKSIKSNCEKFKICNVSRLYYCTNYLQIGGIKKWLEIFTSKLGIFDYSILKLIIRK